MVLPVRTIFFYFASATIFARVFVADIGFTRFGKGESRSLNSSRRLELGTQSAASSQFSSFSKKGTDEPGQVVSDKNSIERSLTSEHQRLLEETQKKLLWDDSVHSDFSTWLQRDDDDERPMGYDPAEDPANDDLSENKDDCGLFRATANHKTGTKFGDCLMEFFEEELGVKSEEYDRYMYESGGDFSVKDFTVNMVRNPFAMIISGYHYHKAASEKWTESPLSEKLKRPARFGVPQSVSAFLQGLNSNSKNLGKKFEEFLEDKDPSYAQILNKLNVVDGLILETLRTLHRNLPSMMSAARSCGAVATRAKSLKACGTCRNVLLDSVMAAPNRVFKEELVQVIPRHLLPSQKDPTQKRVVEHFVEKCAESKSATKHSTRESYSERDAEMALLRELDERFFGGQIHKLEKRLLEGVAGQDDIQEFGFQ